jgi:hypothetical protein
MIKQENILSASDGNDKK